LKKQNRLLRHWKGKWKRKRKWKILSILKPKRNSKVNEQIQQKISEEFQVRESEEIVLFNLNTTKMTLDLTRLWFKGTRSFESTKKLLGDSKS
jgi:hypothetical protein